MRILITGASGHIGAMLRQVFANDEVTLLSRTRITPGANEKWFISYNIQDACWWHSLPPDSNFDVIFHLAEPVKESLGNKVKQKVIDGHVQFVTHFTNKGAKVIYPLTAYLYDRRLSRSNAIYAEIKREVYTLLVGNTRVSFPIIHPICDSAHGLGRLIQTEKRIPFINIMCAFQSTIPVLKLAHLIQVFSNPTSIRYGRFDVFTETLAIEHVFNDGARTNVLALSKAFRYVLMLLRFVPSFNLLIRGRNIDDSIR